MKNVLITGGSNGIGEELCNAYLEKNYNVYNMDIIDNDKLIMHKHYHYIKYDLKAYENVQKIWNSLPMIDILILNAASYDQTAFLKQSMEELKGIVDTNLMGHIACAKAFAKAYNGHHGRIIVITSTRAYMSEPNTIGYTVTKGALTSLVHALAITLQDQNITVNGIAPGWINSHDEDISNKDHAFHPSNRVGTPKDIAQTSLFLSSASNDYINGEIITIDGGVTKKMIYPK